MLIYLFLEKYITLLYLLFKVRFVDNNKNIDYVFYGDGKRYCEFNPDKKSPNTQVTQFCRLYPKDALFRVDICMTDKYILIHLNKINDFLYKKNGYEDTLSRYIFSKRDYRGEKSGKTLEELATKNLQYYFEKKNAIVYTKQFNSDSERSSRFLYQNK
nr:MAG TPA: hypothetical protein [Bacteriophage sp.]